MHANGTRYAVIASHAGEALTVKPALAAAGELPPPLGLTPLGEKGVPGTVTLPPFGIRVFQIAEDRSHAPV